MFKELKTINTRPEVFSAYTAERLWTDPHRAAQMLSYHLNDNIEAASRNSSFIKKSADWIMSHFKITGNSAICDFGCATGLYTAAFARSGASVTGIDFSENSLAYARKTANAEELSISYINCNYLDFKTSEKFDLITLIMCDFCALSPEQRQKILKIFWSILKPGGRIILDVYSYAAFENRKEDSFYRQNQLESFWAEEDYYAFVNIFKYAQEHVILDKYTVITEHSAETVYNWLQYFSAESIEQEFTASGFRISELYSDLAGREFTPDSAEFTVIAEAV